jgi:hypothetical protein
MIRLCSAVASAPRTGPPRSPGPSPQPGGPPLLAVATGPYVGEGFDCAVLDTPDELTPVLAA